MQNKKLVAYSTKLIYFICFSFILFTFFSISVSAQNPIVSITPINQIANPGDQFTINIFVDKILDLKGGSITINFDPNQVRYISSLDGGFLPNTKVLEKKVDNVNGIITIDIASLSGSSCGSGSILYVNFERISSSLTIIDFGNTILRNIENENIPHLKDGVSRINPCLGDFGSENNGPPDGKVDFEDLMIFAIAYGSSQGDPNWNEVCDIAGENGSLIPDGVIDFEDLMIFAMNYGTVCVNNLASKPVVTTQEATMNNDIVTAHGTIEDTGGCDCGTRGFRYTTDPEYQGNIQEVHCEGGPFGEGSYSLELPPVTSNVTYYVQAYAANCVDAGYGNWVSFVFPTENPVHNITQNSYYPTIQLAIDNANVEDIIECSPGTYVESVIINKKLTILGARHDVDPAGSLDRGNESIVNAAGSKAFDVQADEVIINGFKITDASNAIYSERNTATASYNIITDCSSNAIYADRYDTSRYANITASYNTITNSPVGVYSDYYAKISADHNIIDRCLNYGIYSRGSSVLAEYNTITISDYGIYANRPGLIVTANYNTITTDNGIYLEGATVDLNYNTVTGAADGIYLSGTSGTIDHNTVANCSNRGIYATASTLSAHYNKIYGNANYGLYSADSNHALDATCNWWGASSGPTHDGNPGGSGDVVSYHVTYIPFCTSEDCSSCSSTDKPVHNTIQDTYYNTIQEAVSDAGERDVIECQPGTYYENIVVTQSKLTILGARHDVDPAGSLDRGNESIVNAAGSKAFDVQADEVIINGFKITDASNAIYSERNTATASYNIITDCSSNAIYADRYDTSRYANITASYNTITNSPVGVYSDYYAKISADHNIIDRCLNYGIYSRGSSVLAEYNTITISDYGIYANRPGLIVTANYNTITTDNGIYLEGATVDLNYNTVTGAADGIYLSGTSGTIDHNTVANCSNRGIYATASTLSAHYNKIYGNANYGLYSADSNHALDATCNWWGASSGPTHDGNPGGSGDVVSYHVTYIPFCTSEDCSSCSSTDKPVHNTIQDTYYNTIQEAVSDAGERDVIECQPGTYYENIVVTQSKLTILGARHDVDPAGSLDRGNESIVNAAGSKAFDVQADEVIINGFKITDASNAIYSERNTATASYNIITDCSSNAIYADRYDTSRYANITASYNTITNSPVGVYSDYYAKISADHNIIDRCLNYGIYSRGSSVLAEYNTITISDYGIYANRPGLIVTANYNKIYNNYEYGCYNNGADFDATYNWWGASSGPSGGVTDPVTGRVANGTGDKINSNVKFDPFCSDEICSEFCFNAPNLFDPGEQVYPNQSYTLEWTSVEGTTQYRVKESTDPNDFSGDDGYVTSDTSCEVVHSETGTFYYEVRAENEYTNITSPWSNIVDIEVITNPDPVVRRALLVGVGEYTYMSSLDTQSVILDVDRVSQTMDHWFFQPSNTQVSIDTLTGYSATKAEILQKINDTFAGADQNDISYFWIGTHGDYSSDIGSWLVTSDSLPSEGYTYDEWKNSRLFVDELESALSNIPGGGTKVVLIMACHSGGFIGKYGVDESVFNPEEFTQGVIDIFSIKDLLTGNDYQVLTSSSKNELSWGNLSCSLFAKVFCDGCGYEWLYPADTDFPIYEIDLNEAYQYTYEEVLAAYTNEPQHVQVHPENSDFVIVEY